MKNNNNIRRHILALKDIIKNEPADSIRSFVAQQALEYKSPAAFFKDVIKDDGEGPIGKLFTRYTSTPNFYDEHLEEMEEYKSYLDDEEQDADDIKGGLPWAAVDHTAHEMAYELDLFVLT